jgi:hypothetical protein
MPCLSYYLLYFFFYKIREQECGAGSAWKRRVRYQWEEGGGRERGGKMNMVQIMHTHVSKCKNDTC